MQVEIEDQSSTLEALKNWLQINPKRTAVVTVDMHRGHLDPSEATLPVPMDESARVLRHAKDILSFARKQKIPIIHVILVWRPVEVDQINPRVADFVDEPRRFLQSLARRVCLHGEYGFYGECSVW